MNHAAFATPHASTDGRLAGSCDALATLIRPGDTVMWGQSHAEPATLMRALVAQRHSFKRIRVFLGIGLADVLAPEHADAIDFVAYCGSGTNRKLARANMLDILPAHYSQLPELIRSGALRIDVVMLQVSPPDEHGRYSLGLAREYLVEALKHARAIVAEVHPDVPWTYGGPFLRADDIDLLIASDTPFPDAATTPPGPVEQAIGEHVASLVEDGATLQTGIGAIPDAVMAALHDKHDLGVHTGSIGDGIAALCEAGVVTNARKTIDAGITVGGVIIGSARVRRFAHRNPALELRGTEYTHNQHVLRRIDRFVAINSAVEVDLTGQVNAEVVAGTYVGAVGGVGDFLRAAQASRGGVPIVALPSTAGAHSRIVTKLSGPVTVPRSDACVIVTEYGIADLRGLSLAQRVPKMIAVAHPDHRERLAREAGLSG
ncbi:Butanoate coenzyme A-transferase [Burkholderia pseudomultivorans]|uniref:Butanoate coenzyme A-transferase n=2 Tax=Burkholderia pseudomultivorans TaxID=1207504 RepID=A0ABU2E399_9BURK|nr:acetyl-CoA hydrolase/transferase family protein [Burkholderia pseudomultivorans]MDR8726031.1 Butanoate coenzyme A-transferase [Burkholderia pseudomultivorans]MDR8735073.1 Butanoate coenzyme A-transferase [Burkholderia pseudomultivorans]MDR8741106.1 Butanoate coenzyme A-transferase [Burkholderia pseudomultivorans]MDR8754342.1 Butanoate coenzyme A-transferase [Burkholderia pseudomultivorans]MDR8777453.1 Butanoate coenzyme A-transferase [Burkholderia pseudomultivorans]